MAQMRVKDQDLIVEQVVSKIEANELEKLNARKDVQTVLADAEARIEVISRLVEQYNELEETIKAEKEELETILDIYKLLKKDDSEYNLYNESKLLDKLIQKAENELKELKWVKKKTKKKNLRKWLLKF